MFLLDQDRQTLNRIFFIYNVLYCMFLRAAFTLKTGLKSGLLHNSALFAYSGRFRPAFRFDCDRDSGMIATGIPAGIRPQFRSIPTG
jgi:hypothetical protein